MSFRDTVLMSAFQELQKPVHWKVHECQILDYFQVSTGIPWTKSNALQISWCSYFVHWCLVKGGMSPLPRVGTSANLYNKELHKDMGSVGRFMDVNGGVYKSYLVGRKEYIPRPGDMYNRPRPNNHIGFISDVRINEKGAVEIRSLDGNSGPLGFSPLFDGTINPATGKTWIGNGFIYQPPDWRTLTPDCWYIKLCDDYVVSESFQRKP
jgi:hypothetical protein